MDRPEAAASPPEQLRHDLLTAATVLRGTTQLLQRQLARQDTPRHDVVERGGEDR